jgi:hypothetical protein
LRPHIEHVSAFLYGTAGNEKVITQRGERIEDTGASVSFEHLALTPEKALNLVESEDDRERIEDYIASGADLWSRNLDLISDVQKVELEALDPVDLRRIVIEAIEAVLDLDALKAVAATARNLSEGES